MTDQQSPSTDLAVIRQQIYALGSGQETLEQVRQQLETLWVEAETDQNEQRLAVIKTAWDQAQNLAVMGDTALASAQVAMQVIEQIAEQRDEIAEQLNEVIEERDEITGDFELVTERYDELHLAIKTLDYNHPLVSKAMDMLQDDAYESAMESAYEQIYQSDGIHVDDPGASINESYTGIPAQIAGDFACILFDQYSYAIPDHFEKELTDFVNDFTARVNTWADTRQQEYIAQLQALKGKAS